MSWTNAVITDAGHRLQAALLGTGKGLVFTRAVTGAGLAEGELAAQTAVTEERQTLSLQPATPLEDAKTKVQVLLSNAGLETGYTMHQLGFYAKAQDAEDEILYALVQDETGDTIPADAESPGFTSDWSYVFAYGNADSVTVMVDPAGMITWDKVGAAGGVAPLGPDGKVPSEYLGTMGGTLLHIVFDESFKGLMYTITGGDERYSGIVPENLHAVHSLLAVNTEYTLSLRYNERDYVFKTNTSDYYTSIYLIAVVTLDIPAQTGTLVYSGEEQAPLWSGYDPGKMTIGGQVNGTNAGVYTATFTPADGYKWPDGSTGQKESRWTIEKATPTLALDPPTLSLTNGVTSGSCTVTSNGDGTLSASPDDDTIVSASVSGTTVHVTALKNGSTTIAITMSEGQNYTARTETIDVTARNTLLNVTVLGVDGSPMNNVQVSGLTGVSSEKTYTDENGKLMAVLEAGEYTISVPAMEGCIDATLHAQSVTLGENEEKSITLQPVSNGTKELRITSTRKIKMSDNVESIDVFCVGGGGGGGGGNYVPSSDANAIWGGGGGAGGHTTTSLNAPFTPYVEYDAIVGAGGKGGQGIFSSSSVTHGRSGNSGGKTSVLNCTALGGAGGDGGASADAVSSGTGEGGDGGSGGGGGDGGSPGASDTPSEGGAGGVDGADGAVGSRYSKAGKGQGKTTRAFGDPKGELFSSGGQGGAKTAGTAASNVGGGGGGGKSTWNNSGSGTDGKDGVILLRWRLKS